MSCKARRKEPSFFACLRYALWLDHRNVVFGSWLCCVCEAVKTGHCTRSEQMGHDEAVMAGHIRVLACSHSTCCPTCVSTDGR